MLELVLAELKQKNKLLYCDENSSIYMRNGKQVEYGLVLLATGIHLDCITIDKYIIIGLKSD